LSEQALQLLIITVLRFIIHLRTNDTISPSFSLKQELEKNYTGFQKWWSIQQRTSLFVYPIAVTGGFILGVL
jgi:hypothetical protein